MEENRIGGLAGGLSYVTADLKRHRQILHLIGHQAGQTLLLCGLAEQKAGFSTSKLLDAKHSRLHRQPNAIVPIRFASATLS